MNGKEETLLANISSMLNTEKYNMLMTKEDVSCHVSYNMHTMMLLDTGVQKITLDDRYAVLHKVFSHLYKELGLPLINFEAISKSPDFEKVLKTQLEILETKIMPISEEYRKDYDRLVSNVVNFTLLFSTGSLVEDRCVYKNTHSFNFTLTSILYEYLIRLLGICYP